MKLRVYIGVELRSARIGPDGRHLVVDGVCPECQSTCGPLCAGGCMGHPSGPARLLVTGEGRHTTGHDSEAAAAVCLDCRRQVGQIEVTSETIFGVEEDLRMLRGRCRVY